MIPSSAATSVASAVTGFVTEAQRKTWSRGPGEATSSPPRSTATAAVSAGQPSTCRSASTASILGAMDRRTVPAVSPFAEAAGYARVVRIGPHAWVAGTAPIMPDDADPPADAYGQTRRCLEIALAALAETGAGAEHVVRTRIMLTREADFGEIARAHGEVFGHVRPVNTSYVVELLDPRWLLEIELEAFVPQ